MFPYRVIDLSHPITPGMPVWPGDTPVSVREDASHDDAGYAHAAWTLGEHSGTHLGAPWHRRPEGETLDAFTDLDPLPLVVLNARGRDGTERTITVADLQGWEGDHGPVPRGAAVVLFTGWDRRWPEGREGETGKSEWATDDGVFALDKNGDMLWPGWSEEAVEWLVTQRGVRVVGSDAPDIGTGDPERLSAGDTLARLGGWHLENLRGLERVPVVGAWLLLAPLRLRGASGSPVRAMALVPRSLPEMRK